MKYNMSNICSAANRFRKEGYSLSAAFVLAWRLAKAAAVTKVAGVTHGDRQQLLSNLSAARPEEVTVTLAREPENLYDRNAIAVFITTGGKAHKLGYIPQRAAALLSPLMDAGRQITAALGGIFGGWREGMSYGARLLLTA